MSRRARTGSVARRAWVVRAAVLAAAGLLVTSCGGDGSVDLPTELPSSIALPTLTATVPSITRTPIRPDTSSPVTATEPTAPESTTREERPTRTTEPSPATTTVPPQPTAEPTTTTEPAAVQPTTGAQEPATTTAPATSPTTSVVAEPAAEETSGPPSWLWWLLGALVLAAVVAVPLVLRARPRRAWRAGYDEAAGTVAWFAREFIPALHRAGSREELVGGWNVGAGRLAALEDRLAALEASAPDEVARARATTLLYAVRSTRARIEQLPRSDSPAAIPQALAVSATELEAALQSASAMQTA